MSYLARFEANTLGRDFAIGDIHGHFSLLETHLREAGFDTLRDRLFSVGDLIDRGPESILVNSWLEKPWFHAVRGNHEDYAVRYKSVDVNNWVVNGGGWFWELSAVQQCAVARAVSSLPIAIEVQTPGGAVGVLHADCPIADWSTLELALERRSGRDFCMWSRRRLLNEDRRGVAGIRAVIVGHSPVEQPTILGNVFHIDTGGWMPQEGGYFTLIDLHALQPLAVRS